MLKYLVRVLYIKEQHLVLHSLIVFFYLMGVFFLTNVTIFYGIW